MFAGQKTYIVAAVAIIGTIASYLVGDITLAAAAPLVLNAVLAATIRHGIATA